MSVEMALAPGAVAGAGGVAVAERHMVRLSLHEAQLPSLPPASGCCRRCRRARMRVDMQCGGERLPSSALATGTAARPSWGGESHAVMMHRGQLETGEIWVAVKSLTGCFGTARSVGTAKIPLALFAAGPSKGDGTEAEADAGAGGGASGGNGGDGAPAPVRRAPSYRASFEADVGRASARWFTLVRGIEVGVTGGGTVAAEVGRILVGVQVTPGLGPDWDVAGGEAPALRGDLARGSVAMSVVTLSVLPGADTASSPSSTDVGSEAGARAYRPSALLQRPSVVAMSAAGESAAREAAMVAAVGRSSMVAGHYSASLVAPSTPTPIPEATAVAEAAAQAAAAAAHGLLVAPSEPT